MTQVKLGDKNIPFIYQGSELLYPNPVKEGLVLWYDFKGMTNNDISKDVAKDLSGHGNNGTLKNFAYNSESGYNEGLKFDGVDDNLTVGTATSIRTIEITASFSESVTQERTLFSGDNSLDFFYINPSSHFVMRNRRKSTGRYQLKSISNYIERDLSKIKHITLVQDNLKCEVYVNGLSTGIISDYAEEAIDFKLVNIFNFNNTKSLDDTLKSIKVYNRILNEEEIKNNYQLEKERWNL